MMTGKDSQHFQDLGIVHCEHSGLFALDTGAAGLAILHFWSPADS